MDKPLISIIIPVKNGEKTITRCLDAIKLQSLFQKCEVIIVDSGSTDSTLEILKNYPFIRLYHINPKEFNHGTTRNYGVSLANGEHVVMTVQDAWAANKGWLEVMLMHFTDKNVAAVTGQQVVPHEKDKNPHQWFRPQSKISTRKVQFKVQNKFHSLTPEEKYNNCKVDDVTTMYRKSALLQIPFQSINFGEDMQWAKEALLKGHMIVYDNHAQVFHYHHQTFQYVYNVNRIILAFVYKTFGFILPRKYSLLDFLLIIYRNFKYKAQFKWIFFNCNIVLANIKAYRSFKKSILNNFSECKIDIIPQGEQSELNSTINTMRYYSQSGQDRFIDKLFGRKNDGFFLDIGAHDGISFSNTYFFEKYRKWDGICIEPIPEVFEQLTQNRNCRKINACISENEGTEIFIRVEGGSEMLSGLKSHYSPDHLERLQSEIAKNGGKYYEIEVDSIKINNILKKLAINYVDYCNIDTEGSELAILKSINFDNVTIKSLSVENNYDTNQIKSLLRPKGYKLLGRRGADEIYVKKDSFSPSKILIIRMQEILKQTVKKTLNQLSIIKHKLIK